MTPHDDATDEFGTAPTDHQEATRQAPTPAQNAEQPPAPRAKEIGGPKGPEPTRYGDWERKGRCVDF